MEKKQVLAIAGLFVLLGIGAFALNDSTLDSTSRRPYLCGTGRSGFNANWEPVIVHDKCVNGSSIIIMTATGGCNQGFHSVQAMERQFKAYSTSPSDCSSFNYAVYN